MSDAAGQSTSSRRSDAPEAEASGTGRWSMLLASEMLGPFDSEDPDMNIDRWVHQIDQLGEVRGWTAYERATLAQSKLAGTARPAVPAVR
nr:unnamed protein product [Callosobruchus chinensis]